MDAYTIIYLIFFIPGILWIISIWLLSKWKFFKLFFVLNAVLVLAYSLYLIYGYPPFIGHDEYGIQRFGYIIFVPVLHVVINFFLSLVISLKLKGINSKKI